jgi:hypothetical protein
MGAKVMFNYKKQLLCSNNLRLDVKKKLVESCIWSVAVNPFRSYVETLPTI